MTTADQLVTWILGAALVTCAIRAHAQSSSDEELATKLNNPVSSLVSVPFQYNWDQEFGPNREGHKSTLNIQPVIPSKVSSEWNLISRVIVPIVDQRIPFLGDGSQTGIGDITGEFFFVPARPSPGGVLWGLGPAILAPTHTSFISGDKWAVGPTGVIVKQEAGWTYAFLANHLWSVGGGGAQNISNTFIQPILSYTTKDAWTYSINTESSYDWLHSQWTVPINASLSKLTRLGKQPVSFGIGARYYADSPSTGPHGWGARLTVTLLFPE
jgi:hypothetical protein